MLSLILAVTLGLILACSPVALSARDARQVRLFRQANPCPATGNQGGACPGWVVDHIVPLCLGGADTPANMPWQDREAAAKKDLEERRACALSRPAAGRTRAAVH